jgi:hypothetical protein
MNKRFFQFIGTLFVLIGGALFYAEFFWHAHQKGPPNWIFGMLAGLIVLIGVLIFVWVARRKSK